MNEMISNYNGNSLVESIALAQHTVYKTYLSELDQYPLVRPTEALLDEKPCDCLRFIKLTEFTYTKGEDVLQKLATVYHASMSLGCNLAIMIDVPSVNAPVDIYIGVRNIYDMDQGTARKDLDISFQTLKNSIKSNFSGTKYVSIPSQEEMEKLIKEIFGASGKYISSVSCVASNRDKTRTENKNFIQGIEKFIDAMNGHAYTAVFIAEPVKENELATIRTGYEELYSALYPFKKNVWSYNETKSKTITESLNKGITRSVTTGTTHTQAHTINMGVNMGIGTGTVNTETSNSPTVASRTGNVIRGIGGGLGLSGSMLMPVNPTAGMALASMGVASAALGGAVAGESIARSVGNSVNKNMGFSTGYSNALSDSEARNETESESEGRTIGTSILEGTGCSLQIEHINKSVEEMLKTLEKQLKRLEDGADYGAYSCAAYFLSGKSNSSILAANTYRSLLIGEGSSVESGAINNWNGNKDKEVVEGMKEYLSRFVHPLFALPVGGQVGDEKECAVYTPGTLVSGLELPIHLGLPNRSVYGLSVVSRAGFGRNIPLTHDSIELGEFWHMGESEGHQVMIDYNKLTSHVFVTGSTGSGKSNAIYQMIKKISDKDKRFMIIEPAKGEYKEVFGGKDGVTVYGTNARKTKLLCINPFSFPDEIHVLEHIDRLVEILNACWPMYAAMPAVLKSAIEKAYINKGWNLQNSTSFMKDYPTFMDVLDTLPEVMNESLYSSDTKSDYSGALITRVNSLTNGLNGQIFCGKREIKNEDLFDHNVIVDISRVGSVETKSLMMGILVMKLQEYRMSYAQECNSSLKHITVLEEAHNLLRRTSYEQSQESSNLQGKSVEMITNSIAEMRTYGEGFIIADQAPGLLDEAVIRNTNTKIIFRLPDGDDRALMGRSAALTEDQTLELAKLPTGVAAVYQNDWTEAVLCHFEEYKDFSSYQYKEECNSIAPIDLLLKNIFLDMEQSFSLEDKEKLEDWISTLKCPECTKRKLKTTLSNGKPDQEDKTEIAYNLFEGKKVARILRDNQKSEEGVEISRKKIQTLCTVEDERLADEILYTILQYVSEKVTERDWTDRYMEYLGGRIR